MKPYLFNFVKNFILSKTVKHVFDRITYYDLVSYRGLSKCQTQFDKFMEFFILSIPLRTTTIIVVYYIILFDFLTNSNNSISIN